MARDFIRSLPEHERSVSASWLRSVHIDPILFVLIGLVVAFGKAWGALGMGKSSRLIRDRLSARPTFVNALAAASDGRFIPVPGGVVILDHEGFAVGAVGISGDSSEKDEFCAIQGIRAAGFGAEPTEPDENWRDSGLSDQEQ